MALRGKLIMYLEISSKGDMFYDLMKHKPHNISSISTNKIHGCDILDGQLGVVGSVKSWEYTLDGKRSTLKVIIVELDDKNHKIVFNVTEGDLVEDLYNSFKIIFHVEPHGNGRELATWTFEFEKKNTSVPYPTAFMDHLLDITRDMDAYNASQ